MKTDYIENMPEGLELDILIAEKVMGEIKPTYTHEHDNISEIVYSEKENWCCYPEFDKGDICEWKPKPFSSSILCAWEVVEKLRMFVLPFGKTDWCSTNTRNYRGAFENIAVADTAPLAICRAALLATLKDLE